MALAISRQTDRQITVALKDQTTWGTAVSGAGAEKFRFNSGGLTLIKNNELSGENRDDGLTTRGTHGRRRVEGSYLADMSVGSFNTLDAAIMRSTWNADASITEATGAMSSATISVSSGVVTASAGSWITSGARVGHVVQNTAGMNAADQNVSMFIVALTATTMTLARVDGVAITDVAGPVAAYTFVLKKSVIQGSTDYAYTIEEYRQLLDNSELFDSVRPATKSITVTPDQKVTTEFGFLGRNMVIPGTASSPNFTSPTTTTSLGLSSARAKMVLGSGAVTGLSGFNFTLNLNAFLPNEVDEYASDIGYGLATIDTSITLLEADLAQVSAFLAETQTFVGIIIEEPDSSNPKDFFALSMTNCTFGGANKSGGGADRFSARTIPLLVGADDQGGAYDQTMVRFSSSV